VPCLAGLGLAVLALCDGQSPSFLPTTTGKVVCIAASPPWLNFASKSMKISDIRSSPC
jgi:hypothetical protein